MTDVEEEKTEEIGRSGEIVAIDKSRLLMNAYIMLDQKGLTLRNISLD